MRIRVLPAVRWRAGVLALASWVNACVWHNDRRWSQLKPQTQNGSRSPQQVSSVHQRDRALDAWNAPSGVSVAFLLRVTELTDKLASTTSPVRSHLHSAV